MLVVGEVCCRNSFVGFEFVCARDAGLALLLLTAAALSSASSLSNSVLGLVRANLSLCRANTGTPLHIGGGWLRFRFVFRSVA